MPSSSLSLAAQPRHYTMVSDDDLIVLQILRSVGSQGDVRQALDALALLAAFCPDRVGPSCRQFVAFVEAALPPSLTAPSHTIPATSPAPPRLVRHLPVDPVEPRHTASL